MYPLLSSLVYPLLLADLSPPLLFTDVSPPLLTGLTSLPFLLRSCHLLLIFFSVPVTYFSVSSQSLSPTSCHLLLRHRWRRRLQGMSQYFHAYRIDHILGFFRVWEVPGNCVTGRFLGVQKGARFNRKQF